MPPILSIVGRSNVGKTSLLERLIPELKKQGYRLAVIKHDVHGFDIDRPGKDSWRLTQAGSDAVVISSPDKLALIKRMDHDALLEEVALLLGDLYDVILTEGYRHGPAYKVEVHRKEMGSELLCEPRELLAIATDETLNVAVPQFPLDDVTGLVDLLRKELLSRSQPEEVTMTAEGAYVPLSPFVKEIMSKTIRGMVSSLRGLDGTETLCISITRGK
ncbi:MAG: molybdopterin-guanine dinucleotide biosynthesis protein B [Chloroflexi bacterium]|nr:molybdopterin-guanine dinucleotide biosynthesis protein B [Chloroflexota bacterium]